MVLYAGKLSKTLAGIRSLHGPIYNTMYHMKNILSLENIILPKCMYPMKNLTNIKTTDEVNINISDQVTKFLKAPNSKMTELINRQDQLLTKLDNLYERIKTISTTCKVQNKPENKAKQVSSIKLVINLEEIVLVASPENLPWYLNIFLKKSGVALNIKWHIHSSVPNEKVPKIKAFINKMPNLGGKLNEGVNLRLIFKAVSGDSELKLSSLAVPIVGNVNILRYLSYTQPDSIPYDHEDYNIDSLLDLCHLLERTPEKNREASVKKIMLQYKNWIYSNKFTIVDVALYNVVKQWQNGAKYVPKAWFDSMEKLN